MYLYRSEDEVFVAKQLKWGAEKDYEITIAPDADRAWPLLVTAAFPVIMLECKEIKIKFRNLYYLNLSAAENRFRQIKKQSHCSSAFLFLNIHP